MKANEIRVGNLVMDGHDIEVVNSRMIEMLEKREADFDPIPLDESWLIKFGLKHDGGYYWIDIKYDGVYIAWDKDKKCCFLYESSGDGATYGKPIIYIHQLQNLYYALTGTELTITE